MGATAGTVSSALTDFGINDNFLKDLAATMTPGSFARLNCKQCHILDLGQGGTWPYLILADLGPESVSAEAPPSRMLDPRSGRAKFHLRLNRVRGSFPAPGGARRFATQRAGAWRASLNRWIAGRALELPYPYKERSLPPADSGRDANYKASGLFRLHSWSCARVFAGAVSRMER